MVALRNCDLDPSLTRQRQESYVLDGSSRAKRFIVTQIIMTVALSHTSASRVIG